jgi:hypothetical protein
MEKRSTAYAAMFRGASAYADRTGKDRDEHLRYLLAVLGDVQLYGSTRSYELASKLYSVLATPEPRQCRGERDLEGPCGGVPARHRCRGLKALAGWARDDLQRGCADGSA